MARTKLPTVGTQIEVPIDRLDEDQTQPRTQFDDLQGLTESVRKHGIKVPLQVIALSDGRFRVRDGARRRRAALAAGLETVPGVVVAAQAALPTLLDQLLANAQREDLPPQDDAAGMLIYWLGRNVEALGGDGNPPDVAPVSERISVLTERLCQAAGVPDLEAYTSSGNIRVPWKDVLASMGRSGWSDDRRKQHVRRIKHLTPAVLDAITGVSMSAQTVKDLGSLPAAAQEAVLAEAHQAVADSDDVTLGGALRTGLDKRQKSKQSKEQEGGSGESPRDLGDIDAGGDGDLVLVGAGAGDHTPGFEADSALALPSGPTRGAAKLVTDRPEPKGGSTPPPGHEHWEGNQVLILHSGLETVLTSLEDNSGQVFSDEQRSRLASLWQQIGERMAAAGIAG